MPHTVVEPAIDAIDQKIIAELSVDGRMTVTELAMRVGLSKTPCQLRLKRLMDTGIITGFVARVAHARLGLDHVAFVEVTLTDRREAALAEFAAAVRRIPEIEECHNLAGRVDFLLKLRTGGLARLRSLLGDKVARLPHVANTACSVVLETVKETTG